MNFGPATNHWRRSTRFAQMTSPQGETGRSLLTSFGGVARTPVSLGASARYASGFAETRCAHTAVLSAVQFGCDDARKPRCPPAIAFAARSSWSPRALRRPSSHARRHHRVTAPVRLGKRSSPRSTPTSWLLRTRTGSLVDGGDTAALLLAAGVNLANGGADEPVGSARVLHRRG
jgi:hypothetical protein